MMFGYIVLKSQKDGTGWQGLPLLITKLIAYIDPHRLLLGNINTITLCHTTYTNDIKGNQLPMQQKAMKFGFMEELVLDT